MAKAKAKVEELERSFEFNGVKLDDLGTDKSPEEVKDFYTAIYPELVNAAVKGPVTEKGVMKYTFKASTGTKG